ncbi:MAG: galactose/methyl galactoside ABC transporter ATP-binding protein MglA [Erysipelotrichaceae bacterium]
MDQKYILEMVNISKQFPGVKALDYVSLRIKPGTVHALMGENGAGKSTLMKCLLGIYHADEGEVFFDGKEVKFTSPKNALDNGLSMVHQELNQVIQRDVMENIWLGRFPVKGVFVDRKKMYEDTKKVLDDLNIDVDPRVRMNTLSVSERQMVEIAKAVSYNSKLIVMDEPTSSLTEKEVDHLFTIIRLLRKQGVSIIYISHKMEEIKVISDEVTIMRDGKWVATRNSADVTTDEIINLMVGRDLTARFPEKTNVPKEVIFRTEHLTGLYEPTIKDISLELRKGEILGVAGLVGSRRTELVETIFGYRKLASGKMFLHDKEIFNNTTRNAMDNGFALVTEERRATGLFAMLPVSFNSLIANYTKYQNGIGLIDDKKGSNDTKWVIDSMSVKTPSEKTNIGSLSGGNQQKVILGRWLLREPDVLLLDEPTRGIDVGAKFEIYQLMINLAENDKGIIMVSSEMPELLGICDRIAVMSNGRLAGVVETKNTTQEEILRLSALYL